MSRFMEFTRLLASQGAAVAMHEVVGFLGFSPEQGRI